MNILKGNIVSIKQSDNLMLVFMDVEGNLFNSLLLENADENRLEVGMDVHLLFKETEVTLATTDSVVSEKNSFVSKITNIENGKVLANITLDFLGNNINAIITKGALHGLKCKVGDEFRWVVKASEVTLQIL
ncbi:TOBE domain-containing protein [Sulfurimonas sp.]|jgi:molybdopterin-binding protein|uniref:TOBE domain-containing protein n=1 Tax=Sulfurimonas sp. TaxID=2022749 RepID=UPI002A35CB41|nr:TOBE domain-containing protein [Sulfurimonas sp.]MDY0124522.1 TOBE domain-containing protein [Sulfurimonas sp.]